MASLLFMFNWMYLLDIDMCNSAVSRTVFGSISPFAKDSASASLSMLSYVVLHACSCANCCEARHALVRL